MSDVSSVYNIRVSSHLAPGWLRIFAAYEMRIGHSATGSAQTTLLLRIKDQAHLLGILLEVHGAGLQILGVNNLSIVQTGDLEVTDIEGEQS